MNRILLDVAESANPIHGTWNPDLVLAPSIAVLDIMLIDGPLLKDADFITDYSEPTPEPDRPHLRRYCALADRLEAERIDELRRAIVQLLVGLSEDLGCGPSWIVWMKHDARFDLVERHYSIRAFVDGSTSGLIGVNGQMSILEIERDELDDFRERFGTYDGIAGLAVPEGSIHTVLRSLRLASPLPTTRRHRPSPMTTVVDADVLAAVLDCERSMFFEEVDNGTRLRLASTAFSTEQLRTATVARLHEARRAAEGVLRIQVT